MKRWRIHDGNDSWYVQCETKEEAIPLYRKQWEAMRESRREDTWWWEKYGSKLEPRAEEDLEVLEVGQEEHRWGPRPTCCDRINEVREYDDKGPHIQLRVYEMVSPRSDELRIRPRWAMRDVGDVFFCPFCGCKLPEVEEKPEEERPHPVWTPDDGYCGTCGTRNGHGWCECNPPASHYRIKS